MNDSQFKGKIENAESIYLMGTCCPRIYGGSLEEGIFKAVCGCPVATPIYVSRTTPKSISGLESDDNRFYGQRETVGYTYELEGSGSYFSGVSVNENIQLKKNEYANCDGGSISYSGMVTATASDVRSCEPSFPGESDTGEKEVSFINGTAIASWSGSNTFLSNGGFTVENWSYAPTCDPDQEEPPVEPDFVFQDVGVTFIVNSSNLTETYSNCPSYCDIYDSNGDVIKNIKGSEPNTFRPCGASTLGSSGRGYFQTVAQAYLITNLDKETSYSGSFIIQERNYLANYGFNEAPEPEDNWFLKEIVEFEFSCPNDRDWLILDGNLNVTEERFVEEDFSTSIYDYPETFRGTDSDGNPEWNTDGEVVSPTNFVPNTQGKQHRKKMYFLYANKDCAEHPNQPEE